MFLAPEKAIGYGFLQLPNRAQALLKGFGILKLCDLLEFVNANNNIAPFLLSYFLGKLQDFIYVTAFGIYFKRYGKSVIGSVLIEILGLIRERNNLAFSNHSSNLDDVCLSTAAANAS